MKRIGITIRCDLNLFSNGVNQNAIYLANLLKDIGYNVYLIHNLNENSNDIFGIKTLTLEKAYIVPFDLIITLGFAINSQQLKKFSLKKKNVKMVSYHCGNRFIIDMESMIFKHNKETFTSDLAKPNQIWSIPQMEKTNLDYYKFINNQKKATVVPFIWEPLLIDHVMKNNEYSEYSTRSLNRIGVLEPNSSVMKNLLLPVIAIDTFYKENRKCELNNVTLFGVESLKGSKVFESVVGKTDLLKNKIISYKERTNTILALNNMIDIIFSWQWENNLNYLWLETAWMGWPLVHNGNLCQDIGYYYKDFNVNEAVDQLRLAIEEHNTDSEYLSRNREIIKRYTHLNKNLREQYKMLIENVLNDKFEQYSYNWKTNTIK